MRVMLFMSLNCLMIALGSLMFSSAGQAAGVITPNHIQQQGAPVLRDRALQIAVRVGRTAPNIVKTGQLVLVGKAQVSDTIRTGQLVLVGKPQAQSAPDSIRTGQLILVGKPQVPNNVRTASLVLLGKLQVQTAPDTVRTGQLILVGKKR